MSETPRPPVSPGRGTRPGSSKTIIELPTTFGPCRVMIADDLHMPAIALAAHVKELGHTVVGIAKNGPEAIEMAERHLPDLALLDVQMPGQSGIEVAHAIYSRHKIPTIIVSAYSDQENLSKIYAGGDDSGVFGYLLKPVSRDELRVTIGVARQRAASHKAKSTRVEQLEVTLTHRRIIEQAKWILVAKCKLTEPEAHEKLQKLARDRRCPLIEIAQSVIEERTLPT